MGKLKAYKCDCSNEKEIASTMQSVLTDFGPISVLINNAAILAPMKLTGNPLKYEKNIISSLGLPCSPFFFQKSTYE